MARSRKPTAIKELEGNPGRRRLLKNELKLEKANKVPKPPSFLDGKAKHLWRELAPGLYAAGLLTNIDIPAFTSLCQSYSRWRDAEAHISKNGMLIPGRRDDFVKNPCVTISKTYHDIYFKLMRSFGLTPESRPGIAASLTGPNSTEEDDKWDGLIL